MIPPIVNVSDLDELPDAVLADVRWYLDGRSGAAAFAEAHIPGAIFVDLDTVLAAHDQPDTEGRHPFPAPDDFAASMGQLGIGDDTTVVAYDDTGGMTAGRLVVMLRMLGVQAALLDGGVASWTSANGEMAHGHEPEPRPAALTARPWPTDRLASMDEVTAIADGSTTRSDMRSDTRSDTMPPVIIDARARKRFTGEVTTMDRRSGHIPGSRSAPWSAVLANGRFADAATLRAHYEALGLDDTTPAIASCGSGISACINILAAEQAGLPIPRLFVASWSGWSADPNRPAQLGE